MVDQTVLDREHLARYTLGDAALEKEVLGLFVDQMPRLLGELAAAEPGSERERAAHTIKGSARAVGAWALADAAARAETAAASAGAWPALLEEVTSAAEAVRSLVAENFAGSDA